MDGIPDMPMPRQERTNEDEQLAAELRERGKIAEDAASFHAHQLQVAQNVAGACSEALNALLPRLEEKKMTAAEAVPSRF